MGYRRKKKEVVPQPLAYTTYEELQSQFEEIVEKEGIFYYVDESIFSVEDIVPLLEDVGFDNYTIDTILSSVNLILRHRSEESLQDGEKRWKNFVSSKIFIEGSYAHNDSWESYNWRPLENDGATGQNAEEEEEEETENKAVAYFRQALTPIASLSPKIGLN